MTRRTARRIYPKISTMPRQQSEATAHLEMYKLLVEKRRLQQELESLDQRQQQILERLAQLEGQVLSLEKTATQLQAVLPAAPVKLSSKPPAQEFDTLVLEY